MAKKVNQEENAAMTVDSQEQKVTATGKYEPLVLAVKKWGIDLTDADIIPILEAIEGQVLSEIPQKMDAKGAIVDSVYLRLVAARSAIRDQCDIDTAYYIETVIKGISSRLKKEPATQEAFIRNAFDMVRNHATSFTNALISYASATMDDHKVNRTRLIKAKFTSKLVEAIKNVLQEAVKAEWDNLDK